MLLLLAMTGCAEPSGRELVGGPFYFRRGDLAVADGAVTAEPGAGWERAADVAAVPRVGAGTLWIAAPLPEVSSRDPTLYLPQVYLAFDAYVDGVHVARYDEPDGGARAWHMLPLSPDVRGGSWMAIRIRSTYTKTGLRGRIYVGSRADHVESMVRRDTPRLVLFVVFVLAAAAALVAAVRGAERRAFAGFGVFSLSVGLWTLFYTRARDLYLDAPSVWLVLWVLGLVGMVTGFVLFFNALFQRGERVLDWLLRIHVGSSLAAVVVLVVRPPPAVSNAFLTAHRTLIGVSCLVVLWVLARRIREQDRDARIFAAGVLAMSAFAVRDVLLSLGLVGGVDTSADWGTLCFFAAGAWILARRLAALRARHDRYAAELAVAVRERGMMLRDLHDGIGRITTGISLLAEAAGRTGGAHDDRAGALRTIIALAQEGSDEIRTFMRGLDREVERDWAALAAAMRAEAARVLEPLDGAVEVTAKVSAGAEAPSGYLYVHVLRVFQEALTNAIKHAQKPRVRAHLEVEPASLVLWIENDGISALPSELGVNAGAGLRNMIERARELGGAIALDVDTDERRARLELRVPLPLRYSESGVGE
jgi:signal transduction histidine kinase